MSEVPQFELDDLLQSMPNGRGLEIVIQGEQVLAKILKANDLAALAADQTKFHLVILTLRPGSQEFVRALELRHYPPLTPANDLFEMRYYAWQDVLWVIISVPFKDADTVRTMAREYSMRVADGIPAVITSGGMDGSFPMRIQGSERNVFSLEGWVKDEEPGS